MLIFLLNAVPLARKKTLAISFAEQQFDIIYRLQIDSPKFFCKSCIILNDVRVSFIVLSLTLKTVSFFELDSNSCVDISIGFLFFRCINFNDLIISLLFCLTSMDAKK